MDILFLTAAQEAGGASLIVPVVYIVAIGIIAFFVFKKKKSRNSSLINIDTSDKRSNYDCQQVIDYFCKEGCLARKMSDEDYLSLVRNKRDSLRLRKKAIEKIGLEEEEVSEIPPAMFEGFVFKNALAKQNAYGKWVSSSYQVSWIFFSSTQIYLYSCTFNMDNEKKSERTDEFFYKDVTSFSTLSETDVAHGHKGITFEVTSDQFALVVPGDKLCLAMGDVPDAESIIQGMKQKLREKKM